MAARGWSGGLIDDVLPGGRLLAGLSRFLRNPVTLLEARRTLGERLVRREADFLGGLRAACAEPRHPYRRLLACADAGYEDVAELVAHDGLEDALHALYRQGVYLTSDELKGRPPSFAVRRRS